MSIRCDDRFPREARALASQKIAPLVQWKTLFEVGANSVASIGFPHRIFWLRHLDLRSLNNRPMHVCAERRGWRFLLLTGTASDTVEPQAAIETWFEGERWHVSSVRTGTKASSGMRRALEAATKDPRLANGEFEPAYLCCRAVWANALWLRPREGGNGWVVPLPYARFPIRPYEVIPASEYWDQLRFQAARISAPPLPALGGD